MWITFKLLFSTLDIINLLVLYNCSMKISVVIPAYNEEKYIEQCLTHITNQEESPFEIIVVDNNSTDRTAELAKRFNVKVVPEPKQGMIPARNAGFDAAQGDIIARTDADVIVPQDWTKKIRLNFEQHKIDALTGPLEYYEIPSPEFFYKWYLNSFAVFKMANYFLKGKNIMLGPNMILTKAIWNKVRTKVCLDGSKVHEDFDISGHILIEAEGVIRRDDTLIVKTSSRRIKNNPASWYIEYHYRAFLTLLHKRAIEQKAKNSHV